MNGKNYLIFAGLIPLITVIADQFSKYWALDFFRGKFGTPMDACADKAFPGVSYDVSAIFDLTLLCNKGVSFSMLGGDGDIKRWLLAIFASAVTIGLIWYVSKLKDRFTALAVSLLIGGSIGNVIDRVRFGAVVDFLDFSGLKFNYVFNIADSCITAGVIGLLIASFVIKDEPEGPPEQN